MSYEPTKFALHLRVCPGGMEADLRYGDEVLLEWISPGVEEAKGFANGWLSCLRNLAPTDSCLIPYRTKDGWQHTIVNPTAELQLVEEW